MAIAYDTGTNGLSWSTGDPQTFSHTCTGSDLILFVGIFTSGTTVVSGVTYNGTSMTQLSTSPVTDTSSNEGWVFYLVNPSTGSNTVSIDLNTSANCSAVATSYTGVDQTTPIDTSVADAGMSANDTSFTSSSLTVGSSDNWLVSFLRDTETDRVDSSAQLTFRVKSGTVFKLAWDSNGTVSAGSQSVSYTIDPAGRVHGHHLISVNAAAGGAPAASTFIPKIMMVT